MRAKTYSTALQCDCCGTCCRKGGPTLQAEDIPLVAAEVLPLSALVTLRAGELAWDEAAGSLRPQPREAVKVAGTGEAAFPWNCVFHRADGLCGIHDQRPAQCRALLCKDTSALERLYAQGQATRAEVLAGLPPRTGWAALAEAHEDLCSVAACVALALQAQRENTPEARQSAAQALGGMLRQDAAFRALCVEKGGVPEAALLFLLGRPLPLLLEGTGLAAEACGDGWRIFPAGRCVY